jgi:hypothetical protein
VQEVAKVGKNATVVQKSEPQTPVEEPVEIIKRIYIGPSIPRTNLRNARILEGTEEEINAFLAEYKEKFPEVEYLMARPENLSDMTRKVQTKGNILNKYYRDMAAKAVVERKV